MNNKKSPFESATTAVVETKQEAELKSTALTLSQRAEAVVVLDAEDYKKAIEFGKSITELRKKIVDYFAPMKEAAHLAHRAICERETSELAPLALAEKQVKDKVSAFRSEQDRIAREAAAAEQQRLRDIEEKKRAEEVARLKAEGDKKSAKMVAAAPVYVPEVRVQSEAPAVAGIRKRTVYNFKVVDETLVPRQFLCVDEKAIGAFVRAKKQVGSDLIPGVLVTSEEKTDW